MEILLWKWSILTTYQKNFQSRKRSIIVQQQLYSKQCQNTTRYSIQKILSIGIWTNARNRLLKLLSLCFASRKLTNLSRKKPSSKSELISSSIYSIILLTLLISTMFSTWNSKRMFSFGKSKQLSREKFYSSFSTMIEGLPKPAKSIKKISKYNSTFIRKTFTKNWENFSICNLCKKRIQEIFNKVYFHQIFLTDCIISMDTCLQILNLFLFCWECFPNWCHYF